MFTFYNSKVYILLENWFYKYSKNIEFFAISLRLREILVLKAMIKKLNRQFS